MKNCERCGRGPEYKKNDDGSLVRDEDQRPVMESFDYCAGCSQDLCPDCMADGCCGKVPAGSGLKADYGEDPED